MAKTIPKIFTDTADQILASYSFIDFASGRGYSTFYPTGIAVSGATKYALLTNALPSPRQNYNVVVSSASPTSISFDAIFQQPARISGTVFISYTQAANAGFTKWELFHVRGGVETSMGTADDQDESGVTSRELISFEATDTAFVAGDTLRLKATVYRSSGASNTLYFEPTARVTVTETTTGATIGTDAKVLIPFVVDI